MPDALILNNNLDFIKGFASIESTIPFGLAKAKGCEYRPILDPKSTKFESISEPSKRNSISNELYLDRVKYRIQ